MGFLDRARASFSDEAAASRAFYPRALQYGLKKADVDQLLAQGATVTLETGADVGRRITATRLVALGIVGGLLAQKTTGHLFLTFEVAGEPVKLLEVPARHEANVRQWVMEFQRRAAS